MKWLFADAFQCRDDRYLLFDARGFIYPLTADQAKMISFRLGAVLAMELAGVAGFVALAFCAVGRNLDPSGAFVPAWLPDSTTAYVLAVSYWAVTWLLSATTWGFLGERGEEAPPGTHSDSKSALMATRPACVVQLAMVVCLLLIVVFENLGFAGPGGQY